MKISSPSVVLSALLLTFAGPIARGAAPEPLLDGLGTHTFKITTVSPTAQKYFNQGLKFVYGFNHEAAIRSFQQAARFDPQAPMPHWGIALASGPHINYPVVPPAAAELAVKELALARAAAQRATPLERDLIEALSHRYAAPQPPDRTGLDRAYAEAMRKVWQAHPTNADVGALFAESLMDLRPWDQWTLAGQPQPGTAEILATLEAVLQLNVDHPFANHLYIHAVEASPNPERALPAADRLRTLQPGLAHNVHMSSHIYIRVGRWDDAVESNLEAVEADRRYRAAFGPAKGFLPIYVAHNQHMLAYAAMMTGRSELALRHIRAMVAGLSPEFLAEYGSGAEALVAMPLEVMMRFGRWDEILAEPEYPPTQPFTRAFAYAARGIALAAKGDTPAARNEQIRYVTLAKGVPSDETAGNNTCLAILAVVTPMLEGEILIREGKLEAGLAQLRLAVKNEDALRYDEPPGWLIPVRHSLGAVLMNARRHEEAEQVYREDLARHPDNGWGLFGLAEALAAQYKGAEERQVRARFAHVWNHADVTLTSSCFCQPGR